MRAIGNLSALALRAGMLISIYALVWPGAFAAASPSQLKQGSAAHRVAGLPAKSLPPTPVILISVDTLSASHLGVYGDRSARTPNIDSLARGGTVFTAVNAQVPLTLPSHTVLFTSTYPFVNGIRENDDRVPPGAVTLAGLLRAHGYHTAAFIGGYFLARQFGLDQGFEVYDSPFYPSLQGVARAGDLKRNAALVLAAAAPWVAAHRRAPFFLFIHLFDLHRPYSLPAAAVAHHAAAGYDAEIGYIDRTLGNFINLLKREGLWDRALIVFTSDHGESLGAHGENTHGYFVYQSTLWVPLIIHWPAGFHLHPARVDTPMGLIDVAPTLLKKLGLPIPDGFEGRAIELGSSASTASVAGMLPARTAATGPSAIPASEAAVYSESDYPHDHFGCAPLRALRLGAYKLIDTPHAELYNLVSDPAESHNLIQQRPDVAEKLHEREMALLRSYQAKPFAARKPTPQNLALLGSLGYLAGTRPNAAAPPGGAPDAKDRLSEYLRFMRALRLGQTGRLSEAIPMFRQITAEDPGNAQARYDLAECYLRASNPMAGFKELHRALQVAPGYAPAEEALGAEWLARGQFLRAEQRFREVLANDPADFLAHYDLGFILYHQGRLTDSRRHFQAALAASPHSAQVLNSLGLVDLGLHDWQQSESELHAAIRLRPDFALAHYNLGRLFAAEGHKQNAALEFKTALRLDPSLQSPGSVLDLSPHAPGVQSSRH